MSGVGMFGIGGAIGPGNAANAGYHGSPGTIDLVLPVLEALRHALGDGVAVLGLVARVGRAPSARS